MKVDFKHLSTKKGLALIGAGIALAAGHPEIDFLILPLLTELGLKPTEMLILAMLFQNIRETRSLLDKLTSKANLLETKV